MTSLLEPRDPAFTEGMLIIVKSLEEILSNNASFDNGTGNLCLYRVSLALVYTMSSSLNFLTAPKNSLYKKGRKDL